VPVAQRLGWLLELVETDANLEPLLRVAARRTRSVLLDRQQPRRGDRARSTDENTARLTEESAVANLGMAVWSLLIGLPTLAAH
jgi:hypothetical protein